MSLDPNLLLNIVVAVAAVAVSFGVLRGAIASLQRQIDRLEHALAEALRELRESRDKLGERVGQLERGLAAAQALDDVSRPYRLPPRPPK